MGNHTATRARSRPPVGSAPIVAGGPITRRSGGVTVTYANTGARAAVRAMFGRALSPAQLGRVIGVYAPGGATTLTVRGTPTAPSSGQPYLFIAAHGPGFHTDHLLDRSGGGSGSATTPGIFIYNQNRTYDRALLGDEARALALRAQVRAGARLGVVAIGAKAYKTIDGTTPERVALVRMGYDAAVGRFAHETDTRGLPPQFAGVRTLSDLMRNPAGAAWWEQHGMNPDLQFNLTPGSHSMQTLAAYLRDHHLPPL